LFTAFHAIAAAADFSLRYQILTLLIRHALRHADTYAACRYAYAIRDDAFAACFAITPPCHTPHTHFRHIIYVDCRRHYRHDTPSLIDCRHDACLIISDYTIIFAIDAIFFVITPLIEAMMIDAAGSFRLIFSLPCLLAAIFHTFSLMLLPLLHAAVIFVDWRYYA